MHRFSIFILAINFFIISEFVCAAVRLNHLQYIGTHNSYKRSANQKILNFLKEHALDLANEIDYSHLPISMQLEDLGLRHFELDLYEDPKGGRYSEHKALGFLGEKDEDYNEKLLQPGFKVMHVHEIDYRSQCISFKTCLMQIRSWSKVNPNHLPIMILIELKTEAIPDPLKLDFSQPLEANKGTLDAIDQEILAIFKKEEIVTPAFVQGESPSLEDAILNKGWPKLSELRGKVFFALDNGGQIQELYKLDHYSLRDRIMFIDAEPGEPEAAFIKKNDPLGENQEKILDLVKSGYIVRTRTDAGTIEARSNDIRRREAAFASGAQLLSTDYPLANPKHSREYYVSFSQEKKVRCNPFIPLNLCSDFDLQE